MHRIDGPDNVAGMFTAGDPTLGVPGTVVTSDWLNAVQEEIVAVIAAASIALDKPTNTQLRAALDARQADLEAYAQGLFGLTWTNCALQANWVNVAGADPLSYAKSRDGIVYLRGAVRWTPGGTSFPTQLPAAVRPAVTRCFGIMSRNGSVFTPRGITISPSLGSVITPQVEEDFFFDGVSFSL